MIEIQHLPYKTSALEPFMSQRTLEFHYGKHYTGYIEKTNQLIKDTIFENLSLPEIIIQTSLSAAQYRPIYNQAAQAWNHEFFFRGLQMEETKPYGDLKEQIQKDFGSINNFKEEIKNASLSLFGSGWVWVVWKNDKIEILKLSNAENPLPKAHPLWVIDVWEHAYYLDVQNKRIDYIDNILNHLINWEFISENFDLK